MGNELFVRAALGDFAVGNYQNFVGVFYRRESMRDDELITEYFFVKVPSDESRITKQVDSLPVIDVEMNVEVEFEDLLFYFAIAMVSLLFVEWALQTKKNF